MIPFRSTACWNVMCMFQCLNVIAASCSKLMSLPTWSESLMNRGRCMRDCFLGCRLRQPWVKAPCHCRSWTICRCHHPPMNFMWKLLTWPNWSGRGSATQVHDNKRSWQMRNKRWWIAVAVYFRMDIHKLRLEWSQIFLEVADSIIEIVPTFSAFSWRFLPYEL